MSETLRSEILKDFDLKYDLLSWRPQLEAIAEESASSPVPPELENIGPTAVARLGMAAVEQYAQAKVLAKGSIEKMRYITIRYFGEALIESSRWFGEARTMEWAAERAPQLLPDLNQMHLIRCLKRLEFRKMIARGVGEVFQSIEMRKLRLGKKGRQTQQLEIDMTPVRRFQALIDISIMNDCASRVHMTERNNPDAIRKQIRDVVQAYLLNGVLEERGSSMKDCIDTHSKRVAAKLDEVAASRALKASASPMFAPSDLS
jgi:hypothetical protein